MAYNALILSNLRKAFTLLKDIAEDVTLSQQSDGKFNFATKSTEFTSSRTVVAKAIFLSQSVTVDSKSNKKVQDSFLFKTEDIAAPDSYTTITTANGQKWAVVSPCSIDRFVTTINVVKGS